MSYVGQFISAISRLCGGDYNGIGLEETEAWREAFNGEANKTPPIQVATSYFLMGIRYNILNKDSREDPDKWFRIAVNAIPIFDDWMKQGILDHSHRDELDRIINHVIQHGTTARRISSEELIELGLSK